MAIHLKTIDIFKNNFHIHDKIFVAYSGGLDSSVLLDSIIHNNIFKNRVKVIHIDHSYKKESLKWTIFCRLNCNFYKIILYKFKSKVEFKSNLESQFRYIRLHFFLNVICKNKTLFLAHHKNDLFETIFLKLFRGSGFLSFIALNFESKIFQINFNRPLLNLDKYHLLNYIINHGLNFILDNSNFNDKFSRNYLRKIVYSFLSKRWDLDNIIFKNRIFLRSNLNYLLIFLKFFKRTYGFNYKFLNIEYLSKLSLFTQIEILRCWINFFGYKSLNYNHLLFIIKNIFFKKLLYFKFHVKNFLLLKSRYNIYMFDNLDNIFFFKFFFYVNRYEIKLYFKFNF